MEPPNGMGYQAYVNYLLAQEKPDPNNQMK